MHGYKLEALSWRTFTPNGRMKLKALCLKPRFVFCTGQILADVDRSVCDPRFCKLVNSERVDSLQLVKTGTIRKAKTTSASMFVHQVWTATQITMTANKLRDRWVLGSGG